MAVVICISDRTKYTLRSDEVHTHPHGQESQGQSPRRRDVYRMQVRQRVERQRVTLQTFCDSGPRATSSLSSCSAILHVAACCHKMEVHDEVGTRFSLATCGSQAAAQPGKIVRSDRPQASSSIKQPSTSHPAGKRMRDVFC